MNDNERERSWLLKKAIREVFEEYGVGDEEKLKAFLKEAITEWLDAKLARFRKFSLDSLLAVIVAVFATAVLIKWFKGGS